MKIRRFFAVFTVSAVLLSGLAGCAGQRTAPAAPETSAAPQAEALKETAPQETSAPAAETKTAETKATETAAPEEAKAPETEEAKEPETEETKAPEIQDDSNYRFEEDTYPRLDGSTSLAPLARAVTSILLGVPEDRAADFVHFNKTTQSFRNLMNGQCDALIVSEPNAAVYTEMEEAGFRIDKEEISTEALIFVVNENNPVDSLTTEQIRGIYSGEITNWKEVGGNDEEIAAFQRNEGAGSQALMRLLVMKDAEFTKAPEGFIATEMGELMRAVKSFDSSASAIGYSVYYYANDMKMAEGLKILAVDGVEPNAETIRKREYPHLNAYYCVVPSDAPEQSPARVLYNWMVSEDGQRVVASRGYVSVTEAEEKDQSDGICSELPDGTKVHCDYTYITPYKFPEQKFERIAEGPLDELLPRDDYGYLYPYADRNIYEDYSDGYSYSDHSYGLFDAKGRLVTDPVFTEIGTLGYYDGYSYRRRDCGMLYLDKAYVTKSVEDGDDYDEIMTRSVLATPDGSWVSGKDYAVVIPGLDGVCVADSYNYTDFEIYDYSGKLLLSSEQLYELYPEFREPDDDGWTLDFCDYSEGYYLFNLGNEYYFFDDSDLSTDYCFSYSRPFRNGKAIVSMDNEDGRGFGLLSKEDGLILGCVYDSIELLGNGSYLLGEEGGYILADADGKQIVRFPNTTSMGHTKSCLVRYLGESWDEGTEKLFYTLDGKVVFDDTEGKFDYFESSDILSAPGFAPAEDGKMNLAADGDGMWLLSLSTGKTAFFPGMESCYPFYTMDTLLDFSYLHLSSYDPDTEERTVILVDEDLEERARTDGWIYGIPDEITGERYIGIESEGNGGEVELMDSECRPLTRVVGYPSVQNGMALASGDQYFEAVDLKGNLLFRRLMSSAFDD